MLVPGVNKKGVGASAASFPMISSVEFFLYDRAPNVKLTTIYIIRNIVDIELPVMT